MKFSHAALAFAFSSLEAALAWGEPPPPTPAPAGVAAPESPKPPTPPPAASEAPEARRATGKSQSALQRSEEPNQTVEIKAHLVELASLWTKVKAALEGAASAEAKADSVERELLDFDQKTKRALLLIEQTEARRARAVSHLHELEAQPKP